MDSWPKARLGEGLHGLARASGLRVEREDPPPSPSPRDGLSDWMDAAASSLGIEALALSLPYAELSPFLSAGGPAVVRVDDDAFWLVVSCSRRHWKVLGGDGRLHRIATKDVRRLLEARVSGAVSAEVDQLLEGLALGDRARVRAHMVGARLADENLGDIWLLRPPAGAPVSEAVRQAKLPGLFATFAGAYLADYLLFVLSWWLIGRGALRGHIDWGFLAAWALLFATMLPLRMLSTWYEGRVAVAAGGLLKRRLLEGAMRLDPDESRQDGAGRHLARVLESEVVESLAMSGGLLAVVALLELLVSTGILALGSGGIFHALLLGLTVSFFFGVSWRYFQKRQSWTQTRFRMSHELVERMVGHRTRLAQLAPAERHEGEDVQLATYLADSVAADRLAGVLAIIARLWLPIGVLGLAPGFIQGQATLGRLAVGLGGVILAARALDKLQMGLGEALDAVIAWQRIAPLFQAASRETPRGDPSISSLTRRRPAEKRIGDPLVEVRALSYRYPGRREDVIREASFGIRSGDRILLRAPSGGGKSTLISLVNRLRRPSSGTVLLDGADWWSLGAEAWTRKVATAPQFHENHVFTEVFAFNLLMGRRWPPERGDWHEAETLCRELGLGELLGKMPGGMNQLVGDTGWRLSHGERSRLYLARALLQGSELVLLDESFAALDPESLKKALLTARARAESLVVIAHP